LPRQLQDPLPGRGVRHRPLHLAVEEPTQEPERVVPRIRFTLRPALGLFLKREGLLPIGRPRELEQPLLRRVERDAHRRELFAEVLLVLHALPPYSLANAKRNSPSSASSVSRVGSAPSAISSSSRCEIRGRIAWSIT